MPLLVVTSYEYPICFSVRNTPLLVEERADSLRINFDPHSTLIINTLKTYINIIFFHFLNNSLIPLSNYHTYLKSQQNPNYFTQNTCHIVVVRKSNVITQPLYLQ